MRKEELIKLLKDYKENLAKLNLRKKEKNMYEKRIKGCIEIEMATTGMVGQNMDIHSKNKINDKVGNAVIDTIQKNVKIKKEAVEKIKKLEIIIDELQNIVNDTKIRLSCLKYKERELLTAYYVEGRTYEDIGNNLYFSLFSQTRDQETIKKIIEKATIKMIKL